MKKLYLAISIAVFLLFCLNVIYAQNEQTKLNQVQLFKQLTGTWKCEYAKDTILLWDIKSYGEGFDVYIKAESKSKIIWEAKSLVGYDNKNDRLIESQIE